MSTRTRRIRRRRRRAAKRWERSLLVRSFRELVASWSATTNTMARWNGTHFEVGLEHRLERDQ